MNELTTEELVTIVRTTSQWLFENEGSPRGEFVRRVHEKLFNEYLNRPLLVGEIDPNL